MIRLLNRAIRSHGWIIVPTPPYADDVEAAGRGSRRLTREWLRAVAATARGGAS